MMARSATSRDTSLRRKKNNHVASHFAASGPLNCFNSAIRPPRAL